ncbi:MAG: C4-type zinc ribbon domain-containing protein [Saprospiraceae bacterium]|jgi:predicted  nucleic acid-binding Zn-ribbon protein
MAELTVEERLKSLYELQLIDSQIDELEILKGELPMEVRDLEDEIAGLETRYRRNNETVEDLEGEISRYQSNILEANALIERYTKQSDNVKNNREYEALTKELEMQKLDIQLFEKKIKEAKIALETKKETLDSTKERLDAKKADLAAKKVELEAIQEKTAKEEEKLRKKSEKATKKIDERLLKAYTKIRNQYRNGLAVVNVERNSCGGCFNKVPPQLQLEITMRKKIIVCEHCGRVLVDENIMTAKEEEPATN